MNIYSLFKTDGALEKEGIWIEYGTTDGDKPIRIKIARAGGKNTDFSKALEKATKPYRKQIQTGMLEDKVADRLYKDVFADKVVLDWENVQGPDGKDMKFTKPNVLKVFEDLPDLFTDLREQSTNATLFREEVRETDLGNSGKSSATDSSKAQ